MRKNYSKLSLLPLILACTFFIFITIPNNSSTQIHAQTNHTQWFNNINTISSPILLKDENTTVFLDGYSLDLQKIENIEVHSALEANLSADKQNIQLKIKDLKALPVLSELKIEMQDGIHSILLKKPNKVAHTFQLYLTNNKEYKNINVVGNFNDWNPTKTPMKETKPGVWKSEKLFFTPGEIQYKFDVDGHWIVDINNKKTIKTPDEKYDSEGKLPQKYSLLNFKNKSIAEAPFIKPVKISDSNSEPIELEITSNDALSTKLFAFWQNQSCSYITNRSNGNFIVSIPDEATQLEYSFIRVYAYSGKSKSNDLLIPLQYGKLITNTKLLNNAIHSQMAILFSDQASQWLNNQDFNSKSSNDLNTINESSTNLSTEFWNTLGQKDIDKSIVTNGKEEMEQHSQILSDLQFDFNLYKNIQTVLNPESSESNSFTKLNDYLQLNLDTYGYHNLMGNIVDITTNNTQNQQLNEVLVFSLPGIPVLLYESNLTPNGETISDNIKILTRIRHENIAMVYGSFRTLHIDKDVWVYAREYFGNVVIFALNKSNKKQKISFSIEELGDLKKANWKSFFGKDLSVASNQMAIQLEGNDFEILTLDK